MSKFSKHNEKPIWKPKEGSLLLELPMGQSLNTHIHEVGEIFEDHMGQRMVRLIINPSVSLSVPVRDVIEMIRNGMWRIVKDGPIEPEKILKEFKFI